MENTVKKRIKSKIFSQIGSIMRKNPEQLSSYFMNFPAKDIHPPIQYIENNSVISILQQKQYLKIMMNSEKHKISELENVCVRVISIKDTGRTQKIHEDLQQLCKLLIWGERHNSDFFQYFVQIKALDRLLEIFSKTNSKIIVIAIISFFINLIANLSKPECITYFLSHPCLLSLQNIKFIALDTQIAEYYINFLNGISQKIDLNTLHIFFNKRYPTFPLLMQTTRFFNHPQRLVRTKCRSILLSCLKINSPRVKEFAVGFPFVTYYIHECNLLKQYWQIVTNVYEFEGQKQLQLEHLEQTLEDQKQLMMILDDFMKIDPLNVSNSIINAFANQCMSNLLQDLSTFNKGSLNLKVILLVASYLISNIHNKLFTDFMIFSLFSKYYTSTLCVKLLHPVEKPLSYSKAWKFSGFWDSFQDNINQYCQATYFPQEKSIVSDISSLNSQIKNEKTERKYTKEMRSIFGMGTNFYERQIQKIQQIFAIPINSKPENFQRKSVSQLLDELKVKIAEGNINLNDLQQNPVREPLLSFLKSKDDMLIMLTLNLISSVINNKNVSPEILQFAALSVKPKNYDFKSLFDIEQIMKCCFGIMAVDPPSFRVCTYKEASNVIGKLSEIYQGQTQRIPQDLMSVARLALKSSIDRLTPYIYSGSHWDKHLDIFNNVSIENQKYRRKDLYTFGFLEKDITQINTLASHEIYSVHPKFPDQIQARDIWLYVIVRDTYCKLMNLPLKYQVTNCDEKSQKNALKFQIGSPYQIQKDHEIEAGYREMNEKNYSVCSLIFLGGYFIIGVDKVVKYKGNYQECLMITDSSDPSKIMIQIHKKVISVQVENARKAYELKKYFIEMKNLMFKYQLSLLVKQIQWMLEESMGENK